MYNLFLETEAAEEIKAFCAAHPEHDVEDMLFRCYVNISDRGALRFMAEDATEEERAIACDEHWVTEALKGGAHKQKTVYDAMLWVETPEGHEYWERVYLFSAVDDDDYEV